jgi:hypothetical protein
MPSTMQRRARLIAEFAAQAAANQPPGEHPIAEMRWFSAWPSDAGAK